MENKTIEKKEKDIVENLKDQQESKLKLKVNNETFPTEELKAQSQAWAKFIENEDKTDIEKLKKLWHKFEKHANEVKQKEKAKNSNVIKVPREPHELDIEDLDFLFNVEETSSSKHDSEMSPTLLALLQARSVHAELFSELAAMRAYGDTALVIQDNVLWYSSNSLKVKFKFPVSPNVAGDIAYKIKHSYGYDLLACVWDVLKSLPADLVKNLPERGTALLTALMTKLSKGSILTKNQIITTLAPAIEMLDLDKMMPKDVQYFIVEGSRTKVSDIDAVARAHPNFIFVIPTGYCYSSYFFPSRNDVTSHKVSLIKKYNPGFINFVIEGSLDSGTFWFGFLLGKGYDVGYITSSNFIQDYVRKL